MTLFAIDMIKINDVYLKERSKYWLQVEFREECLLASSEKTTRYLGNRRLDKPSFEKEEFPLSISQLYWIKKRKSYSWLETSLITALNIRSLKGPYYLIIKKSEPIK
jgi:hypothetical protein